MIVSLLLSFVALLNVHGVSAPAPDDALTHSLMSMATVALVEANDECTDIRIDYRKTENATSIYAIGRDCETAVVIWIDVTGAWYMEVAGA